MDTVEAPIRQPSLFQGMTEAEAPAISPLASHRRDRNIQVIAAHEPMEDDRAKPPLYPA